MGISWGSFSIAFANAQIGNNTKMVKMLSLPLIFLEDDAPYLCALHFWGAGNQPMCGLC